jgi:hypothetical protein
VALDGTVTSGGRICGALATKARGIKTRAFTFSDARFYVVDADDGDDDDGG